MLRSLLQPTTYNLQPRRGFTLIELLVVISIIGILAAVVTVSSSASRLQARDSERKADLQTVAGALEVYRATNRTYPDIESPSGSWTALKVLLYPTYVNRWPEDPKHGSTHTYQYVSNLSTLAPAGTMYAVEATLENANEAISAPEILETNNGSSNYFITGTYKAADSSIKYRVSGR